MTKTILIVDDETDIRLALGILLKKEGYAVLAAPGGKAALNLLQKKAVDLIIIDFFMPGMNGSQVLTEIRNNKKLKATKVILLTVATFGKQGEKKLKDLKVTAYIQKPFDNKALLAKIKKLLT
jgi:DNA-binding response OmpR family regulator